MKRPLRPCRGAALVEFALVVVFLIFLLFGLIEIGRALFTWNSAVDATRAGARTAAIVAVGDSQKVYEAMARTLPTLQASEVSIEYSTDGVAFAPAGGCARGTCAFVRVSISRSFHPAVFFLPDTIPMPGFSTTVPVEALGAT